MVKERTSLENWIKDNNLSVEFLADNIVEVKGFGKMVVISEKEQTFDERFVLNLNDQEISLLDTDVDYLLFQFGDFWFYHHKDKETELNFFRYIGETNANSLGVPFLGIHGEYELCNGSRSYKDWAKKLKFLGYTAAGICEHQTLAGNSYFQEACKKADIKAIHGRTNKIKAQNGTFFYVKSYVKNEQGWKHLLKIHNTEIIVRHGDGNYITEEEYISWSDGLITVICHDTDLDAVNIELFDKENTFFQFNPIEYASNSKDEQHLRNLKKYLHNYVDIVKPLLLQDCYYLDKGDSIAKSFLNKVGGGAKQFRSDDEYVKDFSQFCFELYHLSSFPELAEIVIASSLQNYEYILKECNYSIGAVGKYLPKYKMNPDEAALYKDSEDMFFSLIQKGFAERIQGKVEDENIYWERLEKEIAVLQEGGVVDYFLILYDVFNYIYKHKGIRALGRGSAAGSLVSYVLGIVQIDPIKYNLLFERFLNKARLLSGSLPDIDSDIPSNFRQDVIEYLIKKYGELNVTYIGTAQAFKLKSGVKDYLRDKGFPMMELNILTSLISEEDNKYGIQKLFEIANNEKLLKKVIKEHPQLVYTLHLILGQPRSFGMHAAGIVIFPEYDNEGNPTTALDYAPLRYSGECLVTELEKNAIESEGFLKADLLGLKQLDKIVRMNELVTQNGKGDPTFEDVDFEDQKVFDLFKTATTEDVFQFNTDVQKSYLLSLQPERIDDLIAANALNRPGTMEINAHMDYVKIKMGEKEEDKFPLLEDILEPTRSLFCLDGDSNIKTSKGLVKLRDVKIGTKVQTEDGTYQTVSNKFNNGVKKTIRIKTTHGEDLVCTPDHQVLTQFGWKEVQHLTPKVDMIKGFWMYDDNVCEKGTERDWVFGHYLADGHQGVFYTLGESFGLKLKEILERNFHLDGVTCKKYGKKSNCWRVSAYNQKGGNGHPNEFRDFLKTKGVWDLNSYTKHLADSHTLMTLGGFFEGDGCAMNDRIGIKNPLMARQLFKICQSNRIKSSYSKRDGVDYITVKTLDSKVPFLIKEKRIKARKHSGLDYISLNEINPQDQISLENKIRKIKKNNFKQFWRTTQKYQRINTALLETCEITANHDLWGLVLSIEDAGDREVYDISVENNHSYVAGGLVVHNCYQEQIMNTYQRITDCDLTETDKFRKTISSLATKGTKEERIEAIGSYKDAFMKGYKEKGISEDEANRVWDKMEAFSSYSFNKSHSACYAMTGFWAAYYKAYYPLEFYTSSLEFGSQDSNKETTPRLISEIFSSNLIKLYPPDINKSSWQYVSDVETNAIYWSLISVKQAGEKAVETLLEEREKNGQYFSFEEFVERAKNTKVNRRVIVNFILSGCFDALEGIQEEKDRLKLLEQYGAMLRVDLTSEYTGNPLHQQNFFWVLLQKQICGLGVINYTQMYKEMRKTIPMLVTTPFSDSYLLQEETQVGKTVAIGGVLMEARERNTRKGAMCQLVLNSNDETCYVTVWPDQYTTLKAKIEESIKKPLFINGVVEYDTYKKINVLKSNNFTQLILPQ